MRQKKRRDRFGVDLHVRATRPSTWVPPSDSARVNRSPGISRHAIARSNSPCQENCQSYPPLKKEQKSKNELLMIMIDRLID